MDVQIALGADIAMAFDECTEYPADRARARASLDVTLRWAKRSKDHFEAHKQGVPWAQTADRDRATALRKAASRDKTPSLFGIVQGGMFADLRRESAERLVEMDFPGYAIGGLSVGEPRELTREMIATTLPLLPADKPRYVMGVGYPDEIAEYARMGVDMMDCVLPTRAARHGLLFTSEGRLNIKNRQYAEDQGPADPGCALPGLPPLQPRVSAASDGGAGAAGRGAEHAAQSGVLSGDDAEGPRGNRRGEVIGDRSLAQECSG